MRTILDDIMAAKRREVAERRAQRPDADLAHLLATAPPIRDFRAALEVPGEVRIIAEVKKASPSAGILRADFDPVAIAQTYEQHGAACVSVLTDGPYFQGRLEYLSAIRTAIGLPLLRKDFIQDRYQVLEARIHGADAVLLIAEVLPGRELADRLRDIEALGMAALVELHDADQLSRIIDAGARLIGINNRDLRTFHTRLDHTLDLMAQLPAGCCLVSESGIRDRADVLRLQAAGVQAILVGETLMKAPEIGRQLDELRGRSVAPLIG